MKIRAFCLLFAASCLLAQEPKNLKILNPHSPIELQREMNVMRAALGVHCDYCHVAPDPNGGGGKWDFASDAKPTKDTARWMIKMMSDLNKTSFGGQPVITCYTCHNGHIKPTTAVPLPQPQPTFPTAVADEKSYPAAKDLIAKYVAAVGDKPKPASRISRGTRVDVKGKSATFDLIESGDRVYVKAVTPDGVIEQSFGPDGGWIRDKDGVRDLKPTDIIALRDVYPAFDPLDPSIFNEQAKTIDKEKIGDRDTWVVFDKLDDNTRMKVWFDAKSGLALRRLTLTNTQVGRIPKQTDFDDYRDAGGGVKVPFEVRFSSVDPWIGSTRTYSEMHPGAAVDPAVFAKPKAPKA